MHARTPLLIGLIALPGCVSDKRASSENAPPAAESSPQASPWEQAKARGISFRGIGNEPGWRVEVGAGETPALHAELDYGERRIDIVHVQPLAAGAGYTGTTGEGVAVKLQLQREDCSDGMSDEAYPVSAKLRVDGKTYAGCGRFLLQE